jgi:O-antigen/teichoic acid export membrane protein
VAEQRPPAQSGELNRAARGSLVTLVGAGSSAVLGFVFSVLLARSLGATAAGVVLQAVAAFSIALSVARLGLDTTAVWLLPRLMSSERDKVRRALVTLLLPAFLAPLAVTAAWYVVRWILAPEGGLDPEVYDALSAVAPFLPAASVMTVMLAATRAFGGVVPFNAIGNIAVPGLRPLLVLVVVLVGGGSTAAALGWAVPWLVGALLSVAVLARQVRRATSGVGGTWRPDKEIRTRVRRFALPRVLASGLDQSITWLDVVLVGIILGSTAAGVYGSVSRFVSAGALVATSLRIVVAPRFSALLSEGKIKEVEHLYTVTARWILLMGAPAYVVLAVFSPTVLGWLGPGFQDGVRPMVILCLGSLVVLAAGNVQALLLMSGRSAASAVNKAVVLVFNVVGNLVLVPEVGITGAAAVWAASMALDTFLAAWQVKRHIGVSVAVGAITYVALVVALVVAVPSLLVVQLLGQGSWQLVLAVVLGGILLVGYAVLDRHRLELDQLRRRPGGSGGSGGRGRPGRSGRTRRPRPGRHRRKKNSLLKRLHAAGEDGRK